MKILSLFIPQYQSIWFSCRYSLSSAQSLILHLFVFIFCFVFIYIQYNLIYFKCNVYTMSTTGNKFGAQFNKQAREKSVMNKSINHFDPRQNISYLTLSYIVMAVLYISNYIYNLMSATLTISINFRREDSSLSF